MIKRILIILFSLTAFGWAGEVEDVLKKMPAPAQEYVRMPAKFVIERLQKTARRSGDPALSGFVIDVRKPGASDMRVDVNLENMTLMEALETVANATGTVLNFEGNRAVFTDAGS